MAKRRASPSIVRRQGAAPPAPPLQPLIFMQRNIDEPRCAAVGGILRDGKCKRRCTVDPPPDDAPRSPMAPLRFRPRQANNGRAAAAAVASFAGSPTDAERGAALRGCAGGGELSCGFLAPSAFEAAVGAAPPHEHCRVVVLTAVLGGSDQLRPPLVPPPAEQRGCFFAFVDEASTPRRGSTPRRAAPPRGGGTSGDTSGGAAVDGTWTLLPLRGAMPFGANQRRNSRVPQQLAGTCAPCESAAAAPPGGLLGSGSSLSALGGAPRPPASSRATGHLSHDDLAPLTPHTHRCPRCCRTASSRRRSSRCGSTASCSCASRQTKR